MGDATPTREDLDRGLLSGLAWSSVAKWGGQLLSWAATLIIARVLTPEDYGIVAASVVVSGFLDLGTGLGLGPALVQASDVDEETIGRASGITIVGGLVGAGVMGLVAPYWASFQGDPRLVPVIYTLAFAVVLTAVQSVPGALLSRSLRFRELAMARLLEGVVTAGVSLTLTFVFRSYWALVLGLLAGKSVFTLHVLVLRPVLPRWPRLEARIRSLTRFGTIVTGDRFLWYFRQNFDVVIIGAVLGQTLLGFFSIAMTLARLPLDKIISILAPVVFPVLSRTQSEPAELRRRHIGISAGVSVIVFPAAAGLGLTAPELVPLLVGEKWIPAVPTMMILASITPLAMLWSLNAPALQAVGRAGLPFRFSVLMTLLSPPAMWMGTRWGIEGVAAAGGLALLTVSLYAFPVTWKALGIRPLDFLRGLRAPGSATIGMVAVVLWTRALVGHWNGAGVLLILVSAGVVTYVGWLLVMHGDEVKVMMTYLKEAWRKRAGNTPTDGPLQFPEL